MRVEANVWPNPTTGGVTVHIEEGPAVNSDESYQDYHVIVNDQSGREILHNVEHRPTFNVDLSGNVSGQYNLKVTAGKKVAIKKIIKE